jgi:predicted nicotinamide N-methyase
LDNARFQNFKRFLLRAKGRLLQNYHSNFNLVKTRIIYIVLAFRTHKYKTLSSQDGCVSRSVSCEYNVYLFYTVVVWKAFVVEIMEGRSCLEEVCDVAFVPFFAETTSSDYKISKTGKSIRTFTRAITGVKHGNAAANELFADNLWPGCFVLADYLSEHPDLAANRSVLELGAGCALPSAVAAALGASVVVITDYPEESVLENIQHVVNSNSLTNCVVIGHQWGEGVERLLDALSVNSLCTGSSSTSSPAPVPHHACLSRIVVVEDNSVQSSLSMAASSEQIVASRAVPENTSIPQACPKFDLILLAEPLWKDTYSQHDNLLRSVASSLSSTGKAVLAFAHRPTESHTKEHDLEFLTIAASKYRLNHTHVGVFNKYKDVYEDVQEKESVVGVDVHLYILYF